MKERLLKNSNFDVIGLLKKIEKFKHFSDQEIQDCVDASKFREYEPGETIIKDGSLDSWVYLLLKGSLAIEKDNHTLGGIKRCGDVFGEMGAIDGSPRSATIRAISKTVLMCLEYSIIEQKLEEGMTNFGYLIYRIFSEVLAIRLRNTTDELIKLKKENIELKHKLRNFITSEINPDGGLQGSLENKKILIVDCNESPRKMLRYIIRDLKFKDVIEATDINTAMDRISTEKIDIIISDSNIAGFSAFDFLQKVRGKNNYENVPFIILMNEAEIYDGTSTSTSNAYDVIVRPFNANTIHAKIRSVMSR